MIGDTIDLNLDRLPATPDLRRKGSRDHADALLARAKALSAEDRALLHAIYADGRSATELATLRKVEPRIVRRRIRVLLNRLRSPLYAFILQQRPFLSPARRRIATLCILQGHSIRAASQRTALSMHAVRKHLHALHALYEAATTTPATTPKNQEITPKTRITTHAGAR